MLIVSFWSTSGVWSGSLGSGSSIAARSIGGLLAPEDAALIGGLNALGRSGNLRAFYTGGDDALAAARSAANHWGGRVIHDTALGRLGTAIEGVAGEGKVSGQVWKFFSDVWASGTSKAVASVKDPHRVEAVWEVIEYPILRGRSVPIAYVAP